MTARSTWRAVPGPVRLLLFSQFAFNTGFYLVVPFLAVHLSGGLGVAGWVVGLVLGLRTFSQQGFFAVGERHVGAHYGVLASFGGVAVLLGSAVVGAVLEPGAASPWVLLAVLTPASGAGLATLSRRLSPAPVHA
ncbi:hypothetical protein AB2L27_13590 [Kineococcus sp. LSe6-4]|uniref:MFS transporter n=1 Tax=Kineococcus halophytocola TaxID=3234027 RepID=A0ABV4H4N6_9ACTN